MIHRLKVWYRRRQMMKAAYKLQVGELGFEDYRAAELRYIREVGV